MISLRYDKMVTAFHRPYKTQIRQDRSHTLKRAFFSCLFFSQRFAHPWDISERKARRGIKYLEMIDWANAIVLQHLLLPRMQCV